MSLIDRTRQPSAFELRVFGILFAVFFGVIGGLILWRTGSLQVAAMIWGGALAVTLAYYAVPTLQWPIYAAWMAVTYPIGWTISHVVLGVIFYGVVTIFGLVMRLFGRDWMHREFETEPRTYWTKLPPRKTSSQYFRQF